MQRDFIETISRRQKKQHGQPERELRRRQKLTGIAKRQRILLILRLLLKSYLIASARRNTLGLDARPAPFPLYALNNQQGWFVGRDSGRNQYPSSVLVNSWLGLGRHNLYQQPQLWQPPPQSATSEFSLRPIPPPTPLRTFSSVGVIGDVGRSDATNVSANNSTRLRPSKPVNQATPLQRQQQQQQQQLRQPLRANSRTDKHLAQPLPPPMVAYQSGSKFSSDVTAPDIASRAPNLSPIVHHLPARVLPLYKSLVSLQNPLLLGGDILVSTTRRVPPPSNRGSRHLYRAALVSPVSLWPNGVIYYELDSSVAHLADLIWRVMQQFHENTCIRFLPRQNNEPDFIRIEALRGCFSYIGRIGGEQLLSLGDGCEFRGTIAHELLHAVGFYHHQNRSDRDDFLEILWENVARGKEDQFRKLSVNESVLLNEFDYNSIMLYGPHTFGKTLDKITMKPKREGVILLEVIEKGGLSALDIDSVNKLYKCNSATFSYEVEAPPAAS